MTHDEIRRAINRDSSAKTHGLINKTSHNALRKIQQTRNPIFIFFSLKNQIYYFHYFLRSPCINIHISKIHIIRDVHWTNNKVNNANKLRFYPNWRHLCLSVCNKSAQTQAMSLLLMNFKLSALTPRRRTNARNRRTVSYEIRKIVLVSHSLSQVVLFPVSSIIYLRE